MTFNYVTVQRSHEITNCELTNKLLFHIRKLKLLVKHPNLNQNDESNT